LSIAQIFLTNQNSGLMAKDNILRLTLTSP
jgi:hypothetical protein